MKFFENYYFIVLFQLFILNLAVIPKTQIVILVLRNKGNLISKNFTLRASRLEPEPLAPSALLQDTRGR
ncbi:MAG: hypothetical protein R6U29_11955, partial [Desulfosudaceae bacterium]